MSPTTDEELDVSPMVEESLLRYRKEYVLAAGDTLEIVVRGVPELCRDVVIRPDGFISLPIAEEVTAAGLTATELDGKLTEALASRLRDPEVTVIATTTRPAMVYVFGEVVSPMPVEFRLASTAAHAVAYAGGFKLSANREELTVIRVTEDGRLRAIRLGGIPSGQPGPLMAMAAMPLKPDDLIFVPETGISQWNYYIRSYITEPLLGINAVLETWTQYRLIQLFDQTLN